MPYQVYSYDRIEELVNNEIRGDVEILRSSYLSEKHKLALSDVQRTLADMADASRLTKHYQVLCSGENQNFDVDLELDDPKDIPTYPITCHICGDKYTAEEDNIIVYFTPTDEYRRFLSKTSNTYAK